MMTKVHKNIISFLVGSSFAYIFVWVIGFVAGLRVPELLRPYNEFVLSYYSNILTVTFTAILSTIIMLTMRKAFTLFTKQNLFYLALPITLFLSYLLIFLSFAAVPVMYVAMTTLLIGLLLSNSAKEV